MTTTRKKPATSGSDEGPAAPMSLADAAHDAIATAVDLSRAHATVAKPIWRREADRVDIVDGQLVLRDWTPTPLVVNGTPTPACERRIGTVRAVVVDLPEVVLSITGSPDLDTRTLHLVDVREHLDDYPWPSSRDDAERQSR